MGAETLSFGPFRLDPTGIVWRDGRPLAIGRRGARLLEILIIRRGQVVPKADLFEAAWPNEAVEESNLSVQIAQLRKHLGAEWIRTVERVGYQLIDKPQPVPLLVAPSLAIRPFRNLGGAAVVLAALTDELTTAFIPFGSLSVVAARDGAAEYVLEGSARREGGKVRITVRLVEQRSGHYHWADRFEIPPTGRPPVGLIASTVEAHIELAEIVAAREQPESSEGPDLFRRAQLLLRTSLPDAYAAAVDLLARALEQDPDNTRYLVFICEALATRISMGWASPDGTDADRLYTFATHGLRQPVLDSDAFLRFGFGLSRSGDPGWGYGLMRRSLDLNPNNIRAGCLTGHAAMHWGKPADAEIYLRRGLSLDPHHYSRGAIMAGLSRIRMANGDFEAALQWATRAHHANPNYGGTHWTLVAASAVLSRAEKSGCFLARFRADHPGVTVERIKSGQPGSALLTSTLEGLDRAGLARSH